MTSQQHQLTGADHARLVTFLKELRDQAAQNEATALSAWCDAELQALVLGRPRLQRLPQFTPGEETALREWLQRWRDEDANLPGLREWCAERFAAVTAHHFTTRATRRRVRHVTARCGLSPAAKTSP